MFIISYRMMWEALFRIRDKQGFKAYRKSLDGVLKVACFGNGGVGLPNYLTIKR